jgi:hypothetical protein
MQIREILIRICKRLLRFNYCWSFGTIILSSDRGHPGLNWGHFDLQSNALPLSYTPTLFI